MIEKKPDSYPPFIGVDEQKRRFKEAAEELSRMDFPEDSPDLDSDWWIKTIKEARTTKLQRSELQ